MINTAVYDRLLQCGLSLDHYFVLRAVQLGEPLPTHRRVTGFRNVLELRGYLLGTLLTEKGAELLREDVWGSPPVPVAVPVYPLPVREEPESFNQWVLSLQARLKARLKELTGRVQIQAKDDNGKPKWDFMPGTLDLHKRLADVMKQYGLTDRERIEKILLRHIEDCHSTGEWKPLLLYYIWKQNVGSRLASSYETFEDQKNEPPKPPKDYATEG